MASQQLIRKVVPIRFDDQELGVIDESAKRAGLTRSAYVRQQALAGAMRKPRTKGDTAHSAARQCRHGLQDCRVCHSGRFK